MTVRETLILALTLGATLGATAPGLAQRAGDEIFTPAELAGVLSGQAVEFFDGSVARYGAGGEYSYTYQPGDPPFRGTFSTAPDSQVCVAFDNGFSRCDTYVRSGERLVLIIADGTRFPVRSIAPLN